MKVKDVIALLQQHDPEMEACLFDVKANFLHDDGEGTGLGIYQEFKVEKMGKEDVPADAPEWVSIIFDSHFIDDDVFDIPETRKCRICGCTDNDCRQCIEKTGKPCHWVGDDLCSACQPLIVAP